MKVPYHVSIDHPRSSLWLVGSRIPCRSFLFNSRVGFELRVVVVVVVSMMFLAGKTDRHSLQWNGTQKICCGKWLSRLERNLWLYTRAGQEAAERMIRLSCSGCLPLIIAAVLEDLKAVKITN